MGMKADQLEEIRQGTRPHMMLQPERVQHSKYQQSQPCLPLFGFPKPRFQDVGSYGLALAGGDEHCFSGDELIPPLHAGFVFPGL
jgi:hypothetical protein